MPPRATLPVPPVSPVSSGLTLLFCPCFSEVELPLKKDGFTSESTTLEALLRGEGIEKKVDTREEENIQEIQVFLCLRDGLGVAPKHHRRASGTPAPALVILSRARAASQLPTTTGKLALVSLLVHSKRSFGAYCAPGTVQGPGDTVVSETDRILFPAPGSQQPQPRLGKLGCSGQPAPAGTPTAPLPHTPSSALVHRLSCPSPAPPTCPSRPV